MSDAEPAGDKPALTDYVQENFDEMRDSANNIDCGINAELKTQVYRKVLQETKKRDSNATEADWSVLEGDEGKDIRKDICGLIDTIYDPQYEANPLRAVDVSGLSGVNGRYVQEKVDLFPGREALKEQLNLLEDGGNFVGLMDNFAFTSLRSYRNGLSFASAKQAIADYDFGELKAYFMKICDDEAAEKAIEKFENDKTLMTRAMASVFKKKLNVPNSEPIDDLKDPEGKRFNRD